MYNYLLTLISSNKCGKFSAAFKHPQSVRTAFCVFSPDKWCSSSCEERFHQRVAQKVRVKRDGTCKHAGCVDSSVHVFKEQK